MTGDKLVVGMIGCGVVGGGTVKLLEKYTNIVKIKTVCVKNIAKKRDFESPLLKDIKFVENADEIINDAQINCVVEVMGGVTTAWDYTRRALEKGKHIITANKALLAKYMTEICDILNTQKSTYLFFEAAVCGGIPVINCLQRGLKCDNVHKISGIMNGTTNYIITKMQNEGCNYLTALKEAQEKGYAEADPSSDIEGWDALSKLCILSKLAYGKTVDTDAVYCQGISRLDSCDFQYAKMLERTIKLLSTAWLKTENGKTKLSLTCTPVLIPNEETLAKVNGVDNAVMIESNNLDKSYLIGPGAGRYATANSIVSDILELASKVNSSKEKAIAEVFPQATHEIIYEPDFNAEFYIRLVVKDHVGVIEKIASVCTKYNVSINSILQTPIFDHACVPFAIITEAVQYSQVQKMCDEITSQKDSTFSFCVTTPFFFPYYH